ncbi:Protein required for attachment to host cells [Loktanella fryxellensis]|uniref:Protein required for attachment to host cells n=1 Tax=Loktanella fryxellensis TaxID=245187 RepID=A0A1H8BGP0_9RHOB|nr:host attachment family protein [Loktanella fryxellensis]SEM81972.1 Protein required for attachment to host cells [Loktanella fryxellensis]
MSTLKNGTWIVVADGEKALFLRNATDGEDPHLEVIRKEEQDNPKDGDQGTDRPGRVAQSSNAGGSAYQETDWHDLAKDRFAADLADILYKQAHKGKFDSLVLVASPQVLGELRNQMHKEVSDKVVGEISKTLTNHPLGEIESIVKAELAA